jgi:hypothetical protein
MVEGARAFVEKRPPRFEPLYGGEDEGGNGIGAVVSTVPITRGVSDGGAADDGVGDSPGAVLRPRRPSR